MINLNAWFQKHDLCAENILYIYRKDRKTVIQRTDGAEFALFVPVHSILSALPEKNFLSISKGIVVCRSHIVNISNDGVYTMSDGHTFQGRKLHDFLVGYTPEKANQFCMAGFILKNTLSENGAVTRGICETDEEFHIFIRYYGDLV